MHQAGAMRPRKHTHLHPGASGGLERRVRLASDDAGGLEEPQEWRSPPPVFGVIVTLGPSPGNILAVLNHVRGESRVCSMRYVVNARWLHEACSCTYVCRPRATHSAFDRAITHCDDNTERSSNPVYLGFWYLLGFVRLCYVYRQFGALMLLRRSAVYFCSR